MNVSSAGFRLSFGSRSQSSALVPKVSEALWERIGEAKLGFSGRRVSMGMAFEVVVIRNGDGVSAGCAFPKRCANFGNENDSNSYAAGIIQFLGYPSPHIPGGKLPGYNKPVPEVLFTNSYTRDSDVRSALKSIHPW